MIVIGKTVKGYWPGAVRGEIPDHVPQVVGYPPATPIHQNELGVFYRAGADLRAPL